MVVVDIHHFPVVVVVVVGVHHFLVVVVVVVVVGVHHFPVVVVVVGVHHFPVVVAVVVDVVVANRRHWSKKLPGFFFHLYSSVFTANLKI